MYGPCEFRITRSVHAKPYAARAQNGGLNLAPALESCEETRLFEPPWRTESSVRRIMDGIGERLHMHFFPIVVPAHNEEKELAETLACLSGQRYPAERFGMAVALTTVALLIAGWRLSAFARANRSG